MKWLRYVAVASLLALAYLLNLGSHYAPSNGDEMVYLRIARLTAQSEQWLPLVSDLKTPSGGEMRNTKPPLLFWQAMQAGQWGGWHLAPLRFPYALQTLLCAGLAAWLAAWLMLVSRRESQPSESLADRSTATTALSIRTAFLAATAYLGFFASYRYGRVVLPTAIECVFLFSICALTLHSFATDKAAWIKRIVATGLLLIPALWAKSFVLVVPVGLWLMVAYWTLDANKANSSGSRLLSTQSMRLLWRSAGPAAASSLLALGGFALWFAIDPDPASIWREFIVGENFVTKFAAAEQGLWRFWLAPLLNAGLLAPVVVGLMLVAARSSWRGEGGSISERLLWWWLFIWLIVFSLPSQRSARYILPAMPALAVLIALNAHRIHRIWWCFSLLLIWFASAAVLWLSWCVDPMLGLASGETRSGYSPLYFASGIGLMVLVTLALLSKKIAALTLACSVAWLALLGAMAAPFDEQTARFASVSQAALQAKKTQEQEKNDQKLPRQKIWVPQNFNAQEERFQFIFGAQHRLQLIPYPLGSAPPGINPSSSSEPTKADLAVIRTKLDQPAPQNAIASRLVLRSRHDPREINWEALSKPLQVQQLLLERESLIQY